jgi:hypothetical protein
MLAAASFAVNPGATLRSPGPPPAARVADEAFAAVFVGFFVDFCADFVAAFFTGFLAAAFAAARLAVFAFNVFFAMTQVSCRYARLSSIR